MFLFSSRISENKENSLDIVDKDIPYSCQVFQLPIQLQKNIHDVNKTVANDLELSICNSDPSSLPQERKSVYETVFQPNSIFAKEVLPLWEKNFSSDVLFLNDSQTVVKIFLEKEVSKEYIVPCDKIKTLWSNVRHDPKFMETYGYLDWSILESFNHNPSVLQAVTVANILSPLMSFFIPFLFLLIPFILIKIQGVPISFSVYIQVLKTLAQHHFIGKAILSFEQFSFEKFLYLIVMLFLYGLQMYQNTMHCLRFYRNTQKINEELQEWKLYVQYELEQMSWFLKHTKDLVTFHDFHVQLKKHMKQLNQLHDELETITPFQCSLSKSIEIGYMLKVYYQLHTNKEYEDALLFSMGFEGYCQLMNGLVDQINKKQISFASFTKDETNIIEQSYPGLDGIKNDITLETFVVITGPNASGKTTFLKTTAINILLSQQIGIGFYASAKIAPYTHIHSYLNIPDTSGRDSLFQAESRRCKQIIDHVLKSASNERHFCILDELYSGTNPLEATKSAYAFLQYLRPFLNVDLILTTHYVSICEKWETENEETKKEGETTHITQKVIKNYHMQVEKKQNKYIPTYCFHSGISHIQGAVQILQEMDYPSEMIEWIQDWTEEEEDKNELEKELEKELEEKEVEEEDQINI